MADFGKINPEKAQAIIKALKDGRINPSEIKQLGLTAEEAKALNEAFSSGQVEIGDFVLVNKGQVEKDGKKVQLSSTQKKSPQVAQESSFWDKAKTVGKYVAGGAALVGGGLVAAAVVGSAPAWAPVAVLGAAAVLFTGCNNKIEASQVQSVTVPNGKDYSDVLDKILKRLDNIDNNNVEAYKKLLEKMQNILTATYANQESLELVLNQMFREISTWLQTIINNQVSIEAGIYKNGSELLDALTKIMTSTDSIDKKLADIMKLLQEIKSIGQSIDDTTKQILEEIKKAKQELIAVLNTNNKEVLAAIAKLDENDQNTLKVLNDIKALITKYGNEGQKLGESILVAIGKIDVNVDLSKVVELLEKLLKGQDVTNKGITNMTNILTNFKAKNEEQLNIVISKLDKINATLEKLGGDVTFGMNAILNAIKDLNNFGPKLDAIIARLDALGEKAQEILQAIKDHDVKITVDVTGKVKCECNCNCGGSHEGILGDLNNLLG